MPRARLTVQVAAPEEILFMDAITEHVQKQPGDRHEDPTKTVLDHYKRGHFMVMEVQAVHLSKAQRSAGTERYLVPLTLPSASVVLYVNPRPCRHTADE
ncbi:hypothetical protein BD414DRAFT_53724 [Trametes punicea]|nr:hypothetical protein BD414DRAFT_53724 [Trametes punicea]